MQEAGIYSLRNVVYTKENIYVKRTTFYLRYEDNDNNVCTGKTKPALEIGGKVGLPLPLDEKKV